MKSIGFHPLTDELVFNVDIEGYWREINKSGTPNYSGVYFVYEGNYNAISNTLTLKKLIYIGESDNVKSCIETHDKRNEWLSYVRQGNELYYSAGPVETEYRSRVAEAYIFKHKPPANDELKYSFPFDQAVVISTGSTALLITYFTITGN